MSEQLEAKTAAKAKKSFDWRMFILLPILLVVLYVMSAGPFVRLVDKGYISGHNRFYGVFYYPFDQTYKLPLFHKPLGRYLRLWAPRRFDRDGNLVSKK
jgi:hypothetical protein